jgi:hypothetical protein
MVTVHTITYNEELMIEFFISHYRKIFPDCVIKIYDNYSTDNTVEIAKRFNCEINYYDSDNQLSDSKFLEIKNNCWKNSETDWVVVCDCDELIQITQDELINEDNNGITLFQFEGYDMVNYDDIIDLKTISFGHRNSIYDKTLLFNKSKIKDINYSPGCHQFNPNGKNVLSKHQYKLFHYKYIGVNYTIERYKLFSDRLCEENHKYRWSYHYKQKTEEIVNYYNSTKDKLIKLI